MNLYDYNKLNLTERAKMLFGDGVFIINVDNFALYVLYDFMVEVVLHNSEIVELRTFKRGALLEKYLEVMELPK